MDKITFEDFHNIMSYDVAKNQDCIEIEFCIDNCDAYQTSWLGKMVDRNTKKVIYWFGLTEDGSQAYDFDSFEQFANAKVFYDKSIKEIWNSVSLLSVDACDIQERLPFYLG
ncbi:MAG TPA: hypothetical protein VIO64_10015 [Pseudobacteroides sp.]|uniref:hypothetical protein n=1 Tax=Pseudobacteroides sp. TaxID=1968840 RepID=UPI002F95D42B